MDCCSVLSDKLLALLCPAWRAVLLTLLSIKHGRYREEELPPVWQLEGGLVDPLTQHDEVVVELAVIEGSQLDRDGPETLRYSSRQVEERRKTFPGGVRIAERKILVARPCKFQRKREREMSLTRQN